MTRADWIMLAIGGFILFVLIPATLRHDADAAFNAGVLAPFERHGVQVRR